MLAASLQYTEMECSGKKNAEVSDAVNRKGRITGICSRKGSRMARIFILLSNQRALFSDLLLHSSGAQRDDVNTRSSGYACTGGNASCTPEIWKELFT